ncbi:MAG: XRE family transcriptional regulator [Chryseobacterium sp.]|uniref:helix-turn-helix domain-containing protein n=1 Tax=Pedobacter agri TaxID=454586 RepID=UPI001207D2D2|nr:helix-turn-helix transcriptional regulator [Pedobacter agri]RZJ92128.1 MAG: XRE family transcriptional regulator [Chryseobacterium sp.]
MSKTFGELLKDIRREKGVSQRGLADSVGVDFSYISKIENNRIQPPSAETIIKISKALGISEEILLANSKKISLDISQAISSSESAIRFMNEVKDMRLSDHEWDRLSQSLKKLR